MQLSVLLLAALLALGSDALQDEEDEERKKEPQPEGVPRLNPDLEDLVPELTANGSLLAVLTPPDSEKKKAARPLSFLFQGTTLKWQTSYGSVPSGAVQIYNSHARRYDYVCKYGCSAGFFNPSMGPRCRYPHAEQERLGYPFQILVNKDGLEVLEWKDGSWGGVPQHSVKTCQGFDVYVGRNTYGLGKVHVRHGAFFLPWEGKEYWYRKYQVLTINTDVYKQRLSNVRYNTNVRVTEHPPETLRQSTITNNQCRPVEKTVTLRETHQEEKRWDTSAAMTAGVSASLTAQIPVIGSLGVSLSEETTRQLSSGATVMEWTTQSVSVTHTVPPNHSCRVRMLGRRYEADVPFAGRLSRSYRDGRSTAASISGTFHGVNMGGVHSVVDRCRPLPNARPCS